MRLPRERKVQVFLLALGLFILLFPYLLRWLSANFYPIGQLAHDLLWDVSLVRRSFLVDPLLDTSLPFSMTTYLLTGFSFILPPLLLSVAVPLMCGVAAIFLFYRILLYIRLPRNEAVLISLFFLTSSGFLFLFSSLNYHFLVLVLSFVSIVLYFRSRYFWSSLFVGLVILEDPFAGFLLLSFFVFFLAQRHNTPKRILYRSLIPLVVIFFTLKLVVIDWSRTVFSASLALSDFGAVYGFDIPLLLLGLIGIVALWKKTQLKITIAGIAIIALAFVNESAVMYSLVFISYYAGRITALLLKRKWVMPVMKTMTLLLIGCTVLFSILAHADRLSALPPSKDLVKAIRKIPPESVMVLSSVEYYPFIRYYTQKRTYQGALSEEIFMSRDLKTTEDLLQTTGIDTFFITNDMQEGLVWRRSGEGLMFLLPHSQKFVLKYSYAPRDGSYQIWVYRPSFEKVS